MKKVLLALSLLSPALSITAMDKKEQELTIILQDGHVTMSAEIALQSKIIQLMYEEFKDSPTANRVDISFVNKKSFELVRPLLVEAFNAFCYSTQHNSLQKSLALQLEKMSPECILEIINLADVLDIPSILAVAIKKYAHYLTDELMRPLNVKEFIDNPDFLSDFFNGINTHEHIKSLLKKEICKYWEKKYWMCQKDVYSQESPFYQLRKLTAFTHKMSLEQLLFVNLLGNKFFNFKTLTYNYVTWPTIQSNPHLMEIYTDICHNPVNKQVIDSYIRWYYPASRSSEILTVVGSIFTYYLYKNLEVMQQVVTSVYCAAAYVHMRTLSVAQAFLKLNPRR